MRAEPMRDWEPTNVTRLQVDHVEFLEDTGIKVMLSAFDVPEAIRGYFDESASKCVIEFRYSEDDEMTIVEHPNPHVSVKVGEDSGRMYQVEIEGKREVCAHCLDDNDDLGNAFDILLKKHKSWRQRTNYKVAKDLIEARKEAFFVDEVVGA